MDFLQSIDVLILTKDEEPNIARTLQPLRGFPSVVVLDSGSTDRTLEIARGFPNVRTCTHPFESHSAQWTHGLRECGLQRAWVLAMDADYVLDEQLVREIAALSPPAGVDGFRVRFRYRIQGRTLSASLYPPGVILYRREAASYVQDGHSQRVVVAGQVLPLQGMASHDDRKPFSTWLAAQDRYARIECEALRRTPWRELNWRDRIRKAVFVAPWLVPLYCLTVGRGILDGRAGLFYALQRGLAEAILSARLLEAALMGDGPR
jgi:glycosyltransferase involved in cell wall biosynthesis